MSFSFKDKQFFKRFLRAGPGRRPDRNGVRNPERHRAHIELVARFRRFKRMPQNFWHSA